MLETTEADSTNLGTRIPNAAPLKTKGDSFEPIKLGDFGPEIRLPKNVSPNDPIALFTMYYSPEIMDYLVENTNLNLRQPENPAAPYARAHD